MLKVLEQISSESKFVNPFWEYKVDKYKMPNGKTGDYHYVHSTGATMIIPVTVKNKFVMINQFRYLNNKTSLEFPGGGLNKNLTPLENAVKELKEETGYNSNSLKKVGEYNPYNGVANEICHIFLAEDLIKEKPNPEESEEFEIMELTNKDISERIISGDIWDGMTLAAWAIYTAIITKIS
ncbi:MAG: NUDIX hydrolase [Ignavibacteriae bacterium]|nr:NUDIX hydrolase [Ignavibacteriota bacterium]